MKKLLIFISLLTILLSCTQKQPVAVISNKDTVIVSTQDKKLFIELHAKYDSIIHINDSLIKSNIVLRQKLNATYDSNKVYRATQKELNRFMDICIKNPSQLVFLKGWYLRAERIK